MPLQKKDGAFEEDAIQRLIDDYPECLPAAGVFRARPLRGICRDVPTAHGRIDNLLMTDLGDIALVEAKVWRNPEARRKVVAQAWTCDVSPRDGVQRL